MPPMMSSWSIEVDGPLITRRESLVVDIAFCCFVDPFNCENGNCSALRIELQTCASLCACRRGHVHLAGAAEPAAA